MKLNVQTKESQSVLTTAQALQKLIDGNARFVAGKSTNQKKYRQQIPVTGKGQYPFAAIVSCVDSRVAAESIFDLSNGDAFNGRLAGNIVNADMLGSLEFATAVSGAKVVLVLGHSKCGAIIGACDDVELGNLTGLLEKIEPAVELVGGSWKDGEKTSKNPAFVEAVGEANIRLVMENIMNESSVIKELIDEEKVLLIAAVYDIDTGSVRFLE